MWTAATFPIYIYIPLPVMKLVPRLTRSKSYTFPAFSPGKDSCFLPSPMHQKSELRVRALFTHCLYRRVILWTATVLVLVFLSLFSHGLRPGSGRILDLVNFRNGGQDKAAASAQDSRKDGLGTEEKQNMPHWIKYRQYVSSLTLSVHPEIMQLMHPVLMGTSTD